MPHLVLDPCNAPGSWSARDATDTPSALIAIAADEVVHPFAQDTTALRVDIQPGAAGHLIRRTIAATDLGDFDAITLWYQADIVAAGGPADALRLRLALGSATLPIGAAGNDWGRYLTTERAGGWSYVIAGLDDLPAAIRSALTTIELQVVASDGAHRVRLDALEAQAPRMVADVDAALLARLDGQLSIGGNPVPAVIAPDVPAGPAQPVLRLTPYESARNDGRALSGMRHGDFTDDGHRLRPAPTPWDLFYAVECDGASRADQAVMVDFVAGRLGGHGWLPVGNRALRIDQIAEPRDARAPLGHPHVLRYRVAAWAESGAAAIPASPVADVALVTGLRAMGAGL